MYVREYMHPVVLPADMPSTMAGASCFYPVSVTELNWTLYLHFVRAGTHTVDCLSAVPYHP